LGIEQDYCVAIWSNTRFVGNLSLLRSESGQNLLKARIAAQRVAAYFAVVAPCVTDRVLILIVEQTKAGSPARKQRNLLGLRHRGFSPHFSQTLDTNFTNLHQLAEAS